MPMKLFALLLVLFTAIQTKAQQGYWQQQLRYDIKAELNDAEKSITGFGFIFGLMRIKIKALL